MPNKKRSTAAASQRRSRRVTRMKESVSRSVILDDVDPLQSSTPKQETIVKRSVVKKLTKQQIAKAVEEFTTDMQNKIDDYEKSVMMFKLSLSRHILKAPLWKFKEYRDEYAVDVIDITKEVENTEPNREPRRLRSSSVDRFKVPVQIKKPTRLSRSVTRSRNSAMKTPNMSQFPCPSAMTPITPKFNINTPVSVLRQPRLGEQAVSLSGSPLHVAIPTASNPTINVPLSDGNVMTILPLNNANATQLLDPECRQKIEYINKYLTQMLNGHNSD